MNMIDTVLVFWLGGAVALVFEQLIRALADMRYTRASRQKQIGRDQLQGRYMG